MKQPLQVILTIMFLEVQAEKVELQQFNTPALRSNQNSNLPGALLILTLSLSHQNWKSEKPVLLVVVYWPAAAANTVVFLSFQISYLV